MKVHIHAVVPAVTSWSEAGHRSLAEISPTQIRDVLPESGNPRALMERGLRSLFKVLKAGKLVFHNPTRGMTFTQVNGNNPMPLDTALIHEKLTSPHPVIAMAVSLVAFHALTAKQVSELLVSDIVDGRLNLVGRSIPLAAAVRERLARWLD